MRASRCATSYSSVATCRVISPAVAGVMHLENTEVPGGLVRSPRSPEEPASSRACAVKGYARRRSAMAFVGGRIRRAKASRMWLSRYAL